MSNLKSGKSLLGLNIRLFALGMGLLLLLSLVSLFFIHQYHLEKVEQQHLQKQALLLDERIDKKVKILHAATLLLANNSIIREALAYEDRDMIISEMRDLREQFGYWTGFVNYAFHVISHDGRSLYRNYDPDNYGQDTTRHPLMIQAQADLTRAHNLIGKGGYGDVYRIINSQPVFARDDSNQLVGFMTVSQGLRQLILEFENDGFEYYVFERELDHQGLPTGDFAVDTAPYFSDRSFSHWRFKETDFNHQSLQLRDGWYFQTQPIYDHQQQLRAVHMILAPEAQICDQAWSQTERVLWILVLVLFILIAGGLVQLFLLKRSVIKPMKGLTRSLNTIIETERYDQLVPVNRLDEIGRVTQLFNQMLSKTDQLIFELNYQKMAIDKSLIISRANKYGTITDVNDNFCKISGFRRDELIGQPHRIVRHPAMDSAVFEDLWHTIQAKKVWQGEVRNRRKNGTSYYVMSYIIPMLNREGEIKEYLSIREDITLVVELRQDLEKALDQAKHEKLLAEEANKAKSEFLSSMSHELRTPLNAIIGYAQLLELAKMEPKSLKQVATILNSAKHLLALINDILDYAKLETGKVQFNTEVIDAVSVVNEAIELTTTQAQAHQIGLDAHLNASRIMLNIDRLRLKQVLVNLLSNAVKYNKPQGKVTVWCQKLEKNQQTYWQLNITDTGVGISAKHMAKLFQPFNRLGHEGSSIEGTGIGLTISKDLVEQMGGWLEVESIEGEGSTFSVFFPLATTSSSFSGSLEDSTETDALNLNQAFKLLYLAKNPKRMQALAVAAQALNQVELKIAPNLQNALEQARAINPGLILIDADWEDTQLYQQTLSEGHRLTRVFDSGDETQLSAIVEEAQEQQKFKGDRG